MPLMLQLLEGICRPMCGIFGVVNLDGVTDIDSETLRSMGDAIRYRGPDDEGYTGFSNKTGCLLNYLGSDSANPDQNNISIEGDINEKLFSGNIAFGHRRLSILDVSFAGHQPMSYLKNRYCITFNGEIYNYVELKAELSELGYEFQGNSDTEVILAAYAHWGVDCSKKFNGDWAFAILDTFTKTVYMSRDRFGIKPLYYWFNNETFVFASEIKALIEHPQIQIEEDISYFDSFLKEGAKNWESSTPILNIKRFPSAHWCLLDLNAKLDINFNCYWQLNQCNHVEEYNALEAARIAEKYYDLLKDAVKIRLRADVPLGFALSGGLDSSSLVYLAQEVMDERGSKETLKTFSAVYNSPEAKDCDESYFIDLLQAKLGFQSYKKEPLSGDIPHLSELVARHWETLPDGSGMSGINTIGLAKEIGLSITIEGQGADEVQAGYERYLIDHLSTVSWKYLFKNIISYISVWRGSVTLPQTLFITLTARIFGAHFTNLILRKFGKNISVDEAGLNQALSNSVEKGLANLLHYGDSRSMCFSIESRVPFMDHRLIEFSMGIPACYKFHNGYSKYFARLAFDKKLPDEITWRKDKMGWPSPENHWFSGPLRKWSKKMLSDSSIVKKMHLDADSRIGTRDRIRLLNIALWEKVFLRPK